MASKIPPSVLQYQMEHIHETRQPGLIAFYAVMWTASILSVLLRLVSRKRKGLKLEADDYTVVLALVFLCGTFVCNFLYSMSSTPHIAYHSLDFELTFPIMKSQQG